MSYVFGVPTKRHVEYQIKEHLPWQYKRLKNHVPFLPKEHLDPLNSLYTWHRGQEEAAQPEEGEEEDANSNSQDEGPYGEPGIPLARLN